MSACVYCGRRVFPWHRSGHLIQAGGVVVRWHTACKGGSL